MKGKVTRVKADGDLELTNEAIVFIRGCIGLVQLRIGAYPYTEKGSYFTSMADAVVKAKDLGADARIYAIQYNNDGKKDFRGIGSKRFPSQVTKPDFTHTDGNHATWHQIRPGFGFWEFSGPKAWKRLPFLTDERYVWHNESLSTEYEMTLYVVIKVPVHKWRPALNGDISAPEAKRAEKK